MHYPIKLFLLILCTCVNFSYAKNFPVILLVPDNNNPSLTQIGVQIIAEALRTTQNNFSILCTEPTTTENSALITTVNQNSSRIALVVIISATPSSEQKITYITYNYALVPPLHTEPILLPTPYNSAPLIALTETKKIIDQLMQHHKNNPSAMRVCHEEFPVTPLKGFTVPALLIECAVANTSDWRGYSTSITHALTHTLV